MSRACTDRTAMVAVFAAGVVAYAAALAGVFVYDDVHAVRDNEAIRSLWSIPSFFWNADTFSALDVRMYRPVVVTSLAIDHAIAGGAAWMFKLTNVLVHASCAALLVGLARGLGIARQPALVAAALFAVHPLASEAVNIVSSRSDLLLGLGLVLGMRGWLAARAGNRWGLALLAVGAVVACGSKATGVVLPVLCVVLEVRLGGGGERWSARAERLVPVVAVAVVYLLVRKACLGMATVGVPKLTGGHDVLNGAGRDLLTQLCVMSHVLPRFLAQSVAPLGLTLDPWIPLHDAWWTLPVLGGLLAIAALTALGCRAGRRRPAVLVGTCMAWLCALPWVLIPLNLPACEHRFYPSLIGLALVAGALLPAALGRRGRIAVAVLLLLGGIGASTRSLDYRDPAVLWTSVLRQHPRSVRGLCGLAIQEAERAHAAAATGDRVAFVAGLQRACELLERAIAVYPSHWAARRNLAEFQIALGPEGAPLVALVMAESLADVEPQNPFYRLLLSRAEAAVAVQTGDPERFDRAVAAALSCLDIAEAKGLVFRTAASARAAQGDLARAIELLDRSVARGLDHESVLLQRAEYLLRMERGSEARRDLRVVLARDPFEPTALRLLEMVEGKAAPGR